ncbi:AraC family transcriptional regulator [Photobacterium sp. WH77]|uniref:helix-turn-helix domain-containing protein n=2 Tax=Photobacterium TaxID=657 RepID=UPI001EDAFF6C|nr:MULTISPECIES: AraC family transcriptional regulator [unclassified Photobacterium]MCG2837275.1 AraC family transcriptional regulator [Photobacterium sp. WH77]MCG2844891.1 AraC family transcriptional regulator [Photobacterium sp. WH80]MDO6583422.1 AraC family transcriptional regulator [Photobacterium sp. 2_MG-2023]
MNIEYFFQNPMIPFPEGYLVVKNKKHQIVACNEAHQKLAGKHEHAQLLGLTDNDLPWRSYANLYQMYEKDIMRGRQYSLRLPLIDVSGCVHQLYIKKRVILDQHGLIAGTMTHALSMSSSENEYMVTTQFAAIEQISRLKDKRLFKVCKRLLLNPQCDLPIEQYAADVGMTSRSLSRLFKSELGECFSQMRRLIRVYLSIPQLLHGRKPSQVALDFGYQSQASYSTVFKQITGLSPGGYVKAHSHQ